MSARWSADSVLALAPDESSRRAAATLARPAPWDGTGATGELVWGLCAGSGKTPYQVIVDLAGPAFRCTCPSRKFPCKHALGLLLLWSAGTVPERQDPPDYASGWAESRKEKSERSKSRSSSGTDRGDSRTPDDPGTGADEVGSSDAARKDGAARRAAERALRVADGLADLREWLRDQVRAGLANTGLGQLDLMAARMVDAQAPGVVTRLRGLSGAVASGGATSAAGASRTGASGTGDSRGRLLSEYAMLHLLTRAHERLEELPGELAVAVRSRVGYPVSREDVLARPPVSDNWLILGVRALTDAAVPGRRIWLRGRSSGQWAMLLTYAAPNGAWQDPATARLQPGTEVHADLHYYPGQPALRAVIGTRHGEPAPAPAPALAPNRSEPDTIDVLLAQWSAALAQDPWLTTWPALLSGTPVPPDSGPGQHSGDRDSGDRDSGGWESSGRWRLADQAGTALPLADRESLWTLLAVSGGAAVTVAGEWHPGGLVALTTWHAGQAVTL
jgi:hypothetical protein